jgi:DNA repair protein RecN (Recombination protein N)
MLLSLKVNNYALIEELLVEFHQGLNIITGETGAGKSILLGALGLILGKRADTSVLSDSESKCIVEADFNIEGYKLEQLFDDNDLDFDKHTLIRREILPSGKSRAFINDTPVTLNVLQDIALRLVDIHSQHQSLMLNQQEFLLGIIDKYCDNVELLQAYEITFNHYRNLQKKYQTAKNEIDTVKSELDFLNHQVEELEKAKISSGEMLQIEQELNQLDSSGDIKAVLHEATQALSADESGILEILRALSSGLGKIEKVYPFASELQQRLETARVELKELDADIAISFDKLEFDPERHLWLKERLGLLFGLLQKYNAESEDELIEKYNGLNEKLALGVDGEFELEKLEKELSKVEEQVQTLANKISKVRNKSFPQIEQKVVQTLKELGIPHGQLKIECTLQPLAITGKDNVQFTFTANKNHPLQEISKIASGGELSRLMLSIKALLSSSVGMPTIILDEIDTGVSGEIASKVGGVIHQMSKGMQVINITHLPQVASRGEAHFKVYKDHSNSHTRTLIKQLNATERLHEIAKMLSGEALTDAAIENARILLSN